MKNKIIAFFTVFFFVQLLGWSIIWLDGPVHRSDFTAMMQFVTHMIALATAGGVAGNLKEIVE